MEPTRTLLLEREEIQGGPVHPLNEFMAVAKAIDLDKDASLSNFIQTIS